MQGMGVKRGHVPSATKFAVFCFVVFFKLTMKEKKKKARKWVL